LWLEGLTLVLAGAEFPPARNGPCDRYSMEAISILGPDAVLVDMRAVNAVLFMLSLVRAGRGKTVIAVGIDESLEQLLEHAGCVLAGYTRRGAPVSELIRLLTSIAGPQESVASRYQRPAFGIGPAEGRTMPLSRRELQILEYVRQGLSNKEIAHLLGIETQTVKNHVHNLLAKLEVRTRGQAAALARRPALHALG
jgi:DNA-binding NarL/FixJ family response regulator